MKLPSGQRSTEWVAWLPGVVRALNGEVMQLTGKWASEAIKAKTVVQKPSFTGRPFGLREQKLPSGDRMRYLYQPGELEGGRRCTTDPVWSLRCTGWDTRWSSPTSPCCITCRMGTMWLCQGRTSGGAPRHPTTAGWVSQALNSSSMYASIYVSARQPAGIASLCPQASVSIPFFMIQHLDSKGESLFRCCS